MPLKLRAHAILLRDAASFQTAYVMLAVYVWPRGKRLRRVRLRPKGMLRSVPQPQVLPMRARGLAISSLGQVNNNSEVAATSLLLLFALIVFRAYLFLFTLLRRCVPMASLRLAGVTSTQKHCVAAVRPATRSSNVAAGAQRILEGKVVSAKMDKTVAVEVLRYKTVARYGKAVRQTKKYLSHDESNECREGDFVRIKEVPRMSKSKTMVVDEVIRKAVQL